MAGVDSETAGIPPERALQKHSSATIAIHADDHLAKEIDVAPAMHVSTTFKYASRPEDLIPTSDSDARNSISAPEAHIYSRLSAPNTTRLEAVLSSLLSAHALTYSSGLAAFHALLVYINPRRIAIGAGYHGCHGVIDILSKLTGLVKVDLHDPESWGALGEGDVVHVETPLNPTGEAYNLAHYAELAHARGAFLTVDATFGPPPLQDPFAHGADAVMHSGTKYFGGHSDMLCGVLAVQRDDWWKGMFVERLHLGSVMGSFEGWLGLRSMRTLELRVQRQSENAEAVVRWLDEALRGDVGPTPGQVNGAGHGFVSEEDRDVVGKTVARVKHASLQKEDMQWLRKQMPNGFGPVFALWMKTPKLAKTLPSKLALFHHATSLGGVESLIEWRRMSDSGVEETLLRISVGVENVADLIDDFRRGFRELAGELGSGKL